MFYISLDSVTSLWLRHAYIEPLIFPNSNISSSAFVTKLSSFAASLWKFTQSAFSCIVKLDQTAIAQASHRSVRHFITIYIEKVKGHIWWVVKISIIPYFKSPMMPTSARTLWGTDGIFMVTQAYRHSHWQAYGLFSFFFFERKNCHEFLMCCHCRVIRKDLNLLKFYEHVGVAKKNGWMTARRDG